MSDPVKKMAAVLKASIVKLMWNYDSRNPIMTIDETDIIHMARAALAHTAGERERLVEALNYALDQITLNEDFDADDVCGRIKKALGLEQSNDK